MQGITYAVYPPPERGLPWLAVVMRGDKLLDTFGCPTQKSAERLLREMRSRQSAKNGSRGQHSYRQGA